MRFSDLADEHVKNLGVYKGASPRTTEAYDLIYGQFRGFLQMRSLTDDLKHFTPGVCEDFAKHLMAQGMKANSVNQKLSGLSSLAEYGRRRLKDKDRPAKGYALDENPILRFQRPKRQRTVRHFLHKDELDRFLRVECSERTALVRDLLLDTGLRADELRCANVEHLWLDQAERVVLDVSVKGQGPDEKRSIPLGKDLGERLVKYVRERDAGPKDPLLVNKFGQRYRRGGFYEVIRYLGEKAGVDRFAVHPHALRHTFNVLARQAGLDVVTRAALLNHANTHTLAQYDHVLAQETFDAREKVRAVLRG